MDKKGMISMETKNNYPLLIIIVIILVCVVALLFLKEEDEEVIIKKEPIYNLVDDYSRFFTINSCVYKFINYNTAGKQEEIVNMLDSDYVESNNINKDNVYQFIEKLNGNYTFQASKIYYEKNDETPIKYYVYGYIIEETMDGLGEKEDYYIIVNLDLTNNLFSVSPYDGSLFKEVNNG